MLYYILLVHFVFILDNSFITYFFLSFLLYYLNPSHYIEIICIKFLLRVGCLIVGINECRG